MGGRLYEDQLKIYARNWFHIRYSEAEATLCTGKIPRTKTPLWQKIVIILFKEKLQTCAISWRNMTVTLFVRSILNNTKQCCRMLKCHWGAWRMTRMDGLLLWPTFVGWPCLTTRRQSLKRVLQVTNLHAKSDEVAAYFTSFNIRCFLPLFFLFLSPVCCLFASHLFPPVSRTCKEALFLTYTRLPINLLLPSLKFSPPIQFNIPALQVLDVWWRNA